jgi:hypothetical protein
MSECIIRAIYPERTTRVYQAFCPEIALPAVARAVAAAVDSGTPPMDIPCAQEREYPIDVATAAPICVH